MNNRLYLFILGIIASIIIMPAAIAKTATTTPIVMGYWENWGTYHGFPMPGNAKGEQNPVLSGQFTGINALAYAFLETAQNGSIQFVDVWSDLDPNSAQDKTFCAAVSQGCPNFPTNAGLGNFDAFTKAPVAHHVISVGGAGHDDNWENAFKNPDQFVASLKILVTTFPQIDWLDIDYEPGVVPSQNIQPLINLVNKIRTALPGLIISYTIPSNANNIQQFGKSNWQLLEKNINYVNIMGYDMHGAFDKANPYTALHSALYANGSDFSDDSAINALITMGVNSTKIILGMPFYGRAVGGVTATGLGQLFTQAVKGDLDESGCSVNLSAYNVCSGMTQYKTLVASSQTAIPVMTSGVVAGVYAYDASNSQFVSYDDISSTTAKAQYVNTHQLGGIMFWALRYDLPVGNANSLLAAIDKVFGITPHPVPTNSVKLELTNNDPNNPITISLVMADKSSYDPFPMLAKANQQGSDVSYTDDSSAIVKKYMLTRNALVLLTPSNGPQLWCPGTLDLSTGGYHHIQVYYDVKGPNCLIN